MQINEEEKNSQFNNEQRKPQSNLIEIQQLTRTRRVFVYWPSQELKNQFIQALEQETTVQFEEYSHLDENEQCSMFKFKSGGIESQKLCEFIKKNPQFKDFQLYASKQAKFSFEKSFSSSSSCSSSINSSSFSLPHASNLLNEEEILNDDDDDANPSSNNNLYRDLNANLTPQQQDNSQIISEQQQYEQELFFELSCLLLANLSWGVSDLYNHIMASSDRRKKVIAAIVLSNREYQFKQILNSRQQYASLPAVNVLPQQQQQQFSFIRNQELLVQEAENNKTEECIENHPTLQQTVSNDDNDEQQQEFIQDNKQLHTSQKQQQQQQQLTTNKYEQNHYDRQEQGSKIKESNKSPFKGILSRSPSPIHRKQQQQQH